MKAFTLGVAAACLAIGVAGAQTTGAPSSARTNSGSTAGTAAVTPATTAADLNQQKPSGDSNPAIVTTASNAATPAHGANSFTSGEAQGRIEKNGFSNVTDLKKDDDGVWRGRAQKDGAAVTVWLDYRGSVGQQ